MLDCCRFSYVGFSGNEVLFNACEEADESGVVRGWGCPLWFPFELLEEGGGRAYHEFCCEKKYCVSMRVLNLFQHLFVCFLKVIGWGGNKGQAFGEN